MRSTESLPAWRRGWTWTLLKCAAATGACIAAASAAMLWILRDIVGRLPGWIPARWLEKIFLWLLGHVWLFGPIVGLIAGAVASLGIVAFDARRGRLRRLP